MPKPNKTQKVEQLKEKLSAAKGIYFADFQGLNVAQANELRGRCRAAGVSFEVVKNTLARRAVDDSVRDALATTLTGPTAIAISNDDEITPAKVIADFVKEFEKPRIKAGLVDGRVMDEAQVGVLAKLPSREVLLGRFAGGLKSPLSKLHAALSSPMQKLAVALKQVAEEKG